MKQPCSACPFRKNSAPGYLGGVWTANALHQHVVSEAPFPCHKTMENEVKMQQCVGAIQYSIKSCKSYRNPQLKRLQDEYRNESRENILNPTEFLEHHKDARLV